MEEYVVLETTQETPDIRTISFTRKDGLVPHFTAGQYITVSFPGLNPVEGKAYSISCPPDLGHMTITVKKIGLFSNKICSLQKGDSFSGSAPYGFLFDDIGKNIVLIGAGVGISPLMSILEASLPVLRERQITLLLSNKTTEDICFRSRLLQLASLNNDNFRLSLHITQKSDSKIPHINRRITVKEYFDTSTLDVDDDYILCGSIDFVKSIYSDLLKLSVPKENISTEIFFES